MGSSFVLIRCESGYEAGVIRELQKINEVKEVQRIFGEYDILVRLETTDEDNIFEIPDKKILDMNPVHSISILKSSK